MERTTMVLVRDVSQWPADHVKLALMKGRPAGGMRVLIVCRPEKRVWEICDGPIFKVVHEGIMEECYVCPHTAEID